MVFLVANRDNYCISIDFLSILWYNVGMNGQSVTELQDWFKNHVTIGGKVFVPEVEQARVILDEHKNLLVTARAGSGKTTTLVAKIIYLVYRQGVNPHEIIAFAFNTKASKLINKKLGSVLVDGAPIFTEDFLRDMPVARTFHSYAVAALSNGRQLNIISDLEKENPAVQRGIGNRSYFIQSIIKNRLNKEKVYEFVRNNDKDDNEKALEKTGEAAIDDRDYYHVRDAHYETLDGVIVKSRAEKIIADYLFEHDIEYYYESPEFYPNSLAKYAVDAESQQKLQQKQKIRPDFYLKKQNVLWENWGISGAETSEEKATIDKDEVFDGGYDLYAANRTYKEWFYAKKWLDEESYTNEEVALNNQLSNLLKIRDVVYTYMDKNMSREDFEEYLDEVMREHKIYRPKCGKEELYERFLSSTETVAHLTEQITSFIDRAEQQFIGRYDELKKLCEAEKDGHIRLFYEIAMQALDYYHSELSAGIEDVSDRPILSKIFATGYNVDFNIVLNKAAKVIERNEESSRVRTEGYRYVFVDEYQDFSELFKKVVDATLDRSPEAHFMAVGDDWQAINSYAGSSLRYYNDFDKYYPEDTSKLTLFNNYRSDAAIVQVSNDFMKNAIGDDSGGTAVKDEGERALNDCLISEVRFRNDKSNNKRGYMHRKYNFVLTKIITENPNKEIKIINRKKRASFCGASLTYAQEDLGEFFKDNLAKYANHYERNVDFATVNASKGEEADIVVILESDPGKFPVFHVDTKLYKVFGDSEHQALDEQKRLFYVALTRAKEKLYIIHEQSVNTSLKKEDNFLSLMDLDSFDEYRPTQDTLESMIKRGIINRVKIKSVRFENNRNRPENHDIIVVATNGEYIRQFSASDRNPSYIEMCKIADKLDSGEVDEAEVYTDVQEGKWIHFRDMAHSRSYVGNYW